MRLEIYSILKNRRIHFCRKFLSVLLTGLLLVFGSSLVSKASPLSGTGIHKPGDAPTVTITVTKDNALADPSGNYYDVVVVTVMNGPLPVSGSLTFEVGGGSSGGNQVINLVNGSATFNLTRAIPGSVTVSVYMGGVQVGTFVMNFIATAGPPDPATSELFIDHLSNTADGVSPDIVHAVIVDANGNPVANTPVVFTVTGGSVAATAGLTLPATGTTGTVTLTGVTDNTGSVSLNITNTVVGDVLIAATVGGVAISHSPAQVFFVVGQPSAATSRLIVDVGSNTADGTSADVVHAHIVDATGNPVAGATVVFTVAGGSAAGSAKLGMPSNGTTGTTTLTGTTDASGNVTLNITNLVAGDVQIAATLNGTAIGSSPADVIFVAGQPVASSSQLIIDVPSNTADGSSADVVHAHIVDANGNPVSGATVVFTVAGGTSASTAKLGLPSSGATGTTTITGTTDASGNLTLDITNTVAGTVQIAATVGGTGIGNSPGMVTFVAGTPVTASSQLITDVPSNTADGASADVVHAHIVDANGNPVAGATVVFTVAGGSVASTAKLALPSSGATGTNTISGTTDANGNLTLNITNTAVGDVQIAATLGGTAIGNSPADVVFVAGAPVTASSQLIIDVPSNTADGTSADVVHAHIVDASGNPVAGATVVFTVAGGTSSGTANLALPSSGTTGMTTITGTTDASGNLTLNITNTVSGTVQIAATVGGTGIGNSPATVTFVSGTPVTATSKLIIDVPSNTADGTSADVVHAHIVDANGNPVAGATVVFTVAGGSVAGTAGLTLPSSGATGATTITGTTDANGNLTLNITNTVVGDVQIAATLGGVAIGNSPADVLFVAGQPATASSQLITDVPSNTADGTSADVVHAHIVDASGNPVSGAIVVLTVTGGTAANGAALLLPGSGTTGTTTVTGTTDAAGNLVLNITNPVAGTVIISATVGGKSISGSPATVTFVAGTPTASGGKTALTIVVNNVVANGVASDSLNALITDANGNPVAGQVVTFTFEAGGTSSATAKFNEIVTVVTDANGNAAIGLTNTVAGTVNIGAYLNGVPITGTAQTVNFTNQPDLNNPQTNLSVIVYEAIANGLGNTIVQAHIVDQNGEPITGVDVVFAIDSGTAEIVTPGPWTTDDNGNVSITLVSKTAGYVLVTATVGGQPIKFGSPARVLFALVNIYVPRAFTPNGDGTNDLLKPILVGIANFHYFSVYNRWGNLIFTTEDPNAGWDGRFKGVAQPVETYLWIAEGVDVNGKKIVQKGMTSLVR